MPHRHPIILLLGLVAFGIVSAFPVDRGNAAQSDEPPFGLPLEGPPGPSTWLLAQPYGNTEFAYRTRVSFYFAGQGLHFGVDLSAPCGTTVVAIGDGVVSEVDSSYHGAGPHSLTIDHPNGYASFYGHLSQRPSLRPGDPVQRGDPVGLSGDPDETCTSRPHLHLEIRNAPSHTIGYNPVPLIQAEWDRIAAVGAQALGFEQDLADPRRWQGLFDQPDVNFGHPLVNDYADAWPPSW
jgi:murein DD-endopeptidase MepM/ murein hydrolase activator NlpD